MDDLVRGDGGVVHDVVWAVSRAYRIYQRAERGKEKQRRENRFENHYHTRYIACECP